MSFAKYADVAKSAKDLLSKPYPDTHKVELKTAGSNGVTFTTEAILGPVPAVQKKKPAAILTVKGEGVVSGNFKVDKLSVDTNRDIAGEFSLAEVVKGTKLTFKATDGTRGVPAEGADPISATVGVEHRADFGTFTTDIELLKKSVDVSALLGFDNFLAGGAVKLSSKAALELDDYSAIIGYKNKDVAVSVQGEKKFSSFAASYHQVVNANLSVAAQAKIPRSADASKFELAAGVQYKSSPEVTLAGKATQAGKFAVSYAQQLSSLTKVTIGAEIDSTKITTDSAHKLAIAVNFTA